MRILFLAPYPVNESPSQRYRFEHYLEKLAQQGILFDYKPFLSRSAWKIFFKPGHYLHKTGSLLGGFLRRWILMTRIGKYDYVYIHREAAPVGPPVFEWIIARLYRKKIVYDYDDAIWIPSVSKHNKIALHFKWFSKVASICRMAQTVTTGNKYLADFAATYCKQVVIIPTVVNTQKIPARIQDHQLAEPVVGWTGTLTTLKYLDIVLPVLQRLQEKMDFTFVVISNSDPKLPLKNYRFINWSSAAEVDDLLTMHIGLMPLYNGELEKGKCGFKAIQYMSLGIPALVSPIGVNEEIVDDGVNGFICETEYDWESKISLLLQDSSLRTVLGIAAKKKIEDQYSVKATEQAFLKIFKS
jgi:glycosyltransferase involved in cell wall biosynthesis